MMLVPGLFAAMNGVSDFRSGPDFSFAMGMGASLMLGWTALLLWADRRPLERCGVLPITVVPVIAGLAANEVRAVSSGFVPLWTQVPIAVLQAALSIAFLSTFARAQAALRRSRLRPPTA